MTEAVKSVDHMNINKQSINNLDIKKIWPFTATEVLNKQVVLSCMLGNVVSSKSL